jgi:predicted transcriptional regulator of viral defense system
MEKSSRQNHQDKVLALAHARQLIRARDLEEQGLPRIALTRLVAAGKLVRQGHGTYGLPDDPGSEHRSLAEVAIRAPRGVICLLSALRVHEIGTQAPFEVWLAIPNNMAPPKMDHPAIRAVHMSGPALDEGIEQKVFDGVNVKVFNAAKTVADCFKFRNKIGLEVALEALREGTRQRKFTTDELWRYAGIDRVTAVIRPYLEALSA